MKLIFNQVTPRYYTIYNENKGKYLSFFGTISWDNHAKFWEFFPEEHEFFTKEQLNSINTFFQGLEDPNDSTD